MTSVLFTCWLSTVHSAMAADLPTIAVVGIHQSTLDPSEQDAAVAALVQAIENTGRFDGVPPGEVRSGILGREPVILEEGLLAGPREKLNAGRVAYNQAAWEDAIGYLTDAITGLRAVMQGANNVDDLWDAYIFLGSCQLLRDRPNETEARAAFSAAVALSPTKPVNPAFFPPNVVKAHEGARIQLMASKGSVQVSAGPNSDLWLDGVARGRAPTTLSDVVPGEHFLLARAPARDGFLRFTMGAGPAPKADLPMVNPSLGAPATTPVGRAGQVDALYKSLASRAGGIDYVLVVGVSDTVLYVQLLDARTRTWSKTVELPFAEDATDEAVQAVSLVLNGVAADGSFTSTASAAPPLDITANSELTLMLTERVAPMAFTGAPAFPHPLSPVVGNTPGIGREPKEHKKLKAGTVLGVLAGVAVAGGASAGGFYLLTREPPGPNQGVAVIQF